MCGFDILLFPFGRQRTSLFMFMRDVLEPVQNAIACRWSRVRQVSGETRDRSRIFQFLPQCRRSWAATVELQTNIWQLSVGESIQGVCL